MRLLRRLEKNHDGIRSAATRQHYIQIYQAMKYLSLDIADFKDLRMSRIVGGGNCHYLLDFSGVIH
jgi:hypothetical protein